jgi:hypothetical protein
VRLANRIARLERRIVPQREPIVMCKGCGQTASGPGPPRYRMIFDGEGDASIPDVCPDCGRRLVYRLKFDQAG